MNWLSRWAAHAAALPMAIAVIGATLSFSAARWVGERLEQESQQRFERAADRVQAEVVRRFTLPQYGLRGAAGSYAANGALSAAQFRAYVASRDIDREFPGVRGFGFIERVQRAELARFIAAVRADGAPDYGLRQLARQDQADLYVIRYIEPMARNDGAWGLDVGSEELRREAIERAVRSGQASLTAPIVLVQDGRRTPGFLLYLPLYRHGAVPATEAEREQQLQGILYAPIVAAELMRDVVESMGKKLDFELLFGPPTAQTTVFNSAEPGAAGLEAVSDGDAAEPHIDLQRSIQIAGSAFTLRVRSTADFEARANPLAQQLLLGGGVLLSVLLAWLVHLNAVRRRRAEQLAESMTAELHRLATVARHTSNAVIITDTTRRISWVNAGFERLTGYTMAEVLGHLPSAFLHTSETLETEVTRLRSALDARQAFRGELLNRDKQGRDYWVELEVQPLLDAQGDLSGFMAIETDITASKLAAQELAHQRERLVQIVAGTGAGTWEHSFVTGVDRFNDTYAATLGQTVEQYMAADQPPFIERIHPDDRVRVEQQLRSHLEGSTSSYEAEFRMQHAQGHWVWILSHGKVFSRHAQGQALGISGIHLDITSRKEAERQLSRERQQLANIIEGTHVGTWEWNVETGHTKFNERWAQIIGLSLAELGPTTIETWSRFAHPEDLTRSSIQLERHFNEEVPHYECELRMRHRDGHWVWVLDRGKLFGRGSEGRPRWMAGTRLDITERKLAEEALRASKTFLDTAGRVAGVGGWRVELESGLVEWTDETCHIHGVAPGFRPKLAQALDFFEPQAQVLVRNAVDEALRSGTGFELEVPLRTATERQVWVRVIAEVELEAGQPRRLIGAIQDVSARRALEAALRHKNELLGSVLESLPCGLSVFDERLELVASNSQYRRLLDFPDALFAKTAPPFEDFIRFNAQRGEYGPGDIEQTVQALVERARQPAVPHCFERVRPSGVPLEIQGAPMPGGGFVTTYSDISERKRAQHEIERSTALLRGAIDAVDEAFVLFDPNDRLVFCNEKYRALYAKVGDLMVPGVSFETVLRAGVERGQFAAAEGRLEEWVAERLAVHRAASSVLVQRQDDGRVVRVVERRMADGHTVGFRIDITDLTTATEAAQEASRAKSQFLANMSHEIRTPMNAILGMLALLRKTELTTRQADYAGKTEGAARSLLGLLNDILDFSKVEAGKMTLEARPFRVDKLMRDLSVILSANAGGKRIEVLFDIDARMPRQLVGDAMRLQQVLINLGGNAIKFTQAGNVVVSVKVVERNATAVALEFSVLDAGIGIAPQDQARIFSGFTQAEASTTRRFGGTGLGLAICQRLVGLMGGELLLESEVGKGSRFHFRLWLDTADEVAPNRTALPLRLRTLVVDDNPAAREVLERMGESLGWTVDVADSGIAALQLLSTNTDAYDAVFIDWQMPGLDGWQTCQRIRELALAGNAPLLVMVTAHGREMLAARSESEQDLINGFLVKPVTASMLYDAIMDARGEAHPARSSRPEPAGDAPRLAGMRLLVAEDNANNQQVARELLEDEGASVQIAANGQLAVDAVAAADPPFDLVLMDLQMPVMDGYTATHQIRHVLGRTALPIVAVTANAMHADREACLAAGMNEHVGKPFDLDQLIEVLRRLTGRGPASAAATRQAELAPQLVAAATAAGVDLRSAVGRLGGQLGVYERLLRNFVRDLGGMPAQLQQHVDAARWTEASQLMHTLKGLAATLGLKDLAMQAGAAETALRNPPSPAAADCGLPATLSAMQRAHAALLAFQQQALTPLRGAAPAVQPGHAASASDATALVAALQALLQLLAESDMEALAVMDRLRGQHAASLGAGLEPLDEAVGNLDFEAATRACRGLLAELAEVTT